MLGPTSLSTSDQPVSGEAGESDSGGLDKAMEGLGLESKAAEAARDKKQTLADLAAASSNSTSTNTFGIKRQG